MCGIVGIIKLDGGDARKDALLRYEDQKGRGQKGFGFVALREDVLTHYERSTTEEEIKSLMAKAPCDTILFHHRYPTSTENIKECAHPIKVSNKDLKHDYYVLHNGCIWNDEKDKERHEKAGYKYTTEIELLSRINKREEIISTKWNDTEVLAIDLAIDLDKGGNGVLLDGSIAFVALEVDKNTNQATKIYWGKDAYMPLKFNETKDKSITICSEGAGRTVDPNTLFWLDLVSGSISNRPYTVGNDRDTSSVLKYEPEENTYSDYPNEYFDLLESFEEAKRQKKVIEAGGISTEDVDQEIQDLEADIEAIELEFDKRSLAVSLNG